MPLVSHETYLRESKFYRMKRKILCSFSSADFFFLFSLKRFTNDEGGIRTDMREIFAPTSRRIKRNLLLQRGARVLGARLRGRSNG